MEQTQARKIQSFTDLKAWQEGHSLVILVYKVTKSFPKEETYSLVDQMRRAASSVTANIARDIGYVNKEDFKKLAEGANTTHKILQGLITKSKTFLNRKS